MREYPDVKLFTPEEANATLELVRPLVERLVGRHRAYARQSAKLEHVHAKVIGNGGGLNPRRVAEAERAAAEAAAAVRAALEEIESLGAQVKDLETGLVDFPARHPADGSPVLLCWRLGEDDVAYWHGLEDGFAGRKPLPF